MRMLTKNEAHGVFVHPNIENLVTLKKLEISHRKEIPQKKKKNEFISVVFHFCGFKIFRSQET